MAHHDGELPSIHWTFNKIPNSTSPNLGWVGKATNSRGQIHRMSPIPGLSTLNFSDIDIA